MVNMISEILTSIRVFLFRLFAKNIFVDTFFKIGFFCINSAVNSIIVVMGGGEGVLWFIAWFLIEPENYLFSNDLKGQTCNMYCFF